MDYPDRGLIPPPSDLDVASAACLSIVNERHARAAHVLIVDDDVDLVDSITDFLKVEGYAVHSAHTGEEGLSSLRSASLPDAILLDVDMPVLGGPGMAHKMLLHDAGEESIPIVLYSGRSDLPAIASKMGTPYSIGKPFTLDALLSLLGRAISERVAPLSA
jgi:DNA-binding NtrC family response regulator